MLELLGEVEVQGFGHASSLWVVISSLKQQIGRTQLVLRVVEWTRSSESPAATCEQLSMEISNPEQQAVRPKAPNGAQDCSTSDSLRPRPGAVDVPGGLERTMHCMTYPHICRTCRCS